jgi:hypothetical protein
MILAAAGIASLLVLLVLYRKTRPKRGPSQPIFHLDELWYIK